MRFTDKALTDNQKLLLVEIEKAKSVCAQFFKLNPADIDSHSRKKEIIFARMVATHIIYLLTRDENRFGFISMAFIGKHIGGIDNIDNTIKKAEALLLNKDFERKYIRINKLFNGDDEYDDDIENADINDDGFEEEIIVGNTKYPAPCVFRKKYSASEEDYKSYARYFNKLRNEPYNYNYGLIIKKIYFEARLKYLYSQGTLENLNEIVNITHKLRSVAIIGDNYESKCTLTTAECKKILLFNNADKKHDEKDITPGELDYIRKNWSKIPRKTILKSINKGRNNIITLAKLKSIAKHEGLKKLNVRKIDKLLDREVDFIKSNYKIKSDDDLATLLNGFDDRSRAFSIPVIYNVRMQLGLKRTKEENVQIKSNIEVTKISGSRDSLGRFVDQGKKITRKKKIIYESGHISLVNEKRAFGNIKRARIKVDKKWRYLSNHIWENAYGPVPDGFKLVYKDRNPDESDLKKVRLENMELISVQEIAEISRNKRVFKKLAA